MSRQPPIREPPRNTAPPEAQAVLLAARAPFAERIVKLKATVHELQPCLQFNSSNSSRPRSADSIRLNRRPPAPPLSRRRRRRRVRRKASRALVPPVKPRCSIDRKPTAGRDCVRSTRGEDSQPLIRHAAEFSRIELIVDEYRLHRLTRLECETETRAAPPTGVPVVRFGAYLQVVPAGADRSSRRQDRRLVDDLFGPSISTGPISKLERLSAAALEAPYNEAARNGQTIPLS